MTGLAKPGPVKEIASALDAQALAAIRAGDCPVVIRQAFTHGPAVEAARQGPQAVVAYLKGLGSARPVSAIIARPEEGGRFFYNADMSGMNFIRGQGRLEIFLDDLLRAADIDRPPAMAVQSEIITDILPGFAAANRFNLLAHVQPRIWIGNAIRVAPHYDVQENIAACIAGRRRFTLFPPTRSPISIPAPLKARQPERP